MVSLFYRLFFQILILPALLYLRLFKKSSVANHLAERFGFRLPTLPPSAKKPIWIQMNSIGEAKAAAPLVMDIHKAYPDIPIVFSYIMESGEKTVKELFSFGSAYFYLPFDLPCAVKRVVTRINPQLYIIIDSEFWPVLFEQLKRSGSQIAIVNAKISEKSAKKYRLLPFVSRFFFSTIDKFCVQSALYRDRFKQIGVDSRRIAITGNIKYDTLFQQSEEPEKEVLRKKLKITDGPLIVIGSSHETEEVALLRALKPLFEKLPSLRICIAPRDSGRFNDVAKIIASEGFSCARYTQIRKSTGGERVILLDVMGALRRAYEIATLSIVAGSYLESVGGHNLFEPLQAGSPVFFGPFTQEQPEMADLILTSKAGLRLNLAEIAEKLLPLLLYPAARAEMVARGQDLIEHQQGSCKRTLAQLKELITKY